MADVPVHCCCEPGKHLGWLPDRGDTITWAICPTLTWADVQPLTPQDAMVPVERFTLRKRVLGHGLRKRLAYDSGHQPIEVLRTLPGWRDA